MKFSNLSACLAALFALSACSQNGSVALKGMEVSTNQVGDDTYINMNATVAMGNLKFPNVEFPIINPTNLQVLGQMALMTNPDGTNKIYVSVDYTESTHLDPTLGRTLPNQREIPASLGATGTNMIGIPILQNSRIYIGGDSKSNIFVGAAIAIPAFDSVMTSVAVPISALFGYPFSADITGFAGLFTGPVAGENGIMVFVKKSATPATTTPVTAFAQRSAKVTTSSVETPIQPTGGEELSKLSNSSLIKLDRLFKKNAVLKIR